LIPQVQQAIRIVSESESAHVGAFAQEDSKSASIGALAALGVWTPGICATHFTP
jgi:hypothetical protein